MNRVKTLLTAGLALAMAFTLSCSEDKGDNDDNNSGGTLTLTGIPNEFDGNYVYITGITSDGSVQISGCQSVNEGESLLSTTIDLYPIADGSVSMPVWKWSGAKVSGGYTGNDRFNLSVSIYPSSPYRPGADRIGQFNIDLVALSGGSASTSWNDAKKDALDGTSWKDDTSSDEYDYVYTFSTPKVTFSTISKADQTTTSITGMYSVTGANSSYVGMNLLQGTTITSVAGSIYQGNTLQISKDGTTLNYTKQ
jgi:hypothetical protein